MNQPVPIAVATLLSPEEGEAEAADSAASRAQAPKAPAKRRRGLDPYQVSAVVRAGNLAFGGCQALAVEAQNRDGAVTVDWLVRPDGSVGDVSVVDSSFGDSDVDECVAAVAKGLRFPEAAASTRVAWKVRFQAVSRAAMNRDSEPQ